jgi:hypothetical protein
MSALRRVVFFAAASAWAVACGNTTTLGGDKSRDGGGTSGSLDGGSGEDGASAASSGGSSGSGGSGGVATGDAGLVDAPPLPCNLPEPVPNPNPTPEELERAQLIHDYCVRAADDGCLPLGGTSFISQQTTGCPIEQQIIACEEDRALEHARILPACDDEWQAQFRCYIAAGFECGPGPGSSNPCQAEGEALNACIDANDPWQSVTGSRATCDYGPGNLSPCEVNCPVGPNYFQLLCGGPDGLPVHCVCLVNGNAIGNFDTQIVTPLYASDCRDAATQAANGECIKLLDCCFEYFDGTKDACLCGSDPARLGMPSCEAAAEFAGGKVVDICPQYEMDPAALNGACWPPGSCGS